MRIERNRYLTPLQEIGNYKNKETTDNISFNFGISAANTGSRTINDMLFDNDFLYALDMQYAECVHKYTKSLSYIGSTPSYGDEIRAFAIDDAYIYAGGDAPNTIRKYLKSDLSYVGESASYGGIISSLVTDDTYIYAVGNANKIRKYLKSDLSYVGESADIGVSGAEHMRSDDDYIYVSGMALYAVKKYLKSDLSYIGTTTTESTQIIEFVIDDTHIYLSVASGGTIKKYLKSDLSYVAQTTPGYNFRNLFVSDDFLYAVRYSTPRAIRKYTKTFSFVADSFGDSYFSSVSKDKDFIYFGTTYAGNKLYKMFEGNVKYKKE